VAENKERKDMKLKQTMEPQAWIFNAINYANRARQKEPKMFKNAVAGCWTSLFPRLKEDLIEKLDEDIPDMSAKEIRDYNKDGFETSYDLSDCIESKFDGAGQYKKIKASEVLLDKIMEVLADSNLLYKKDLRSYGYE